MNDPRDAQDSTANIGVQAEVFHGDVYVYQTSADTSPERTFEVGVRCLSGGMSTKARWYIRDAVLNGYVTNRSCFYLLLAVLSGRTLQQVPKEDLSLLTFAEGKIAGGADDEWTRSIKVINKLLVQARDANSPAMEEDLEMLGDTQRDEILQHLEMFINGSVRDSIWAHSFDSARRGRGDRGRKQRVWKFFEPKPIDPRVRAARPPQITFGDWILAITTGTVLLAAVLHISVQSWGHSWSMTVLTLFFITVGCYLGTRNGIEWRHRVERLRTKDRERTPVRQQAASAPARGFAGKIDRQFIDYFGRYVPRYTDRAVWVAATSGIRQMLRDEVVELYREGRTPAERVAWLTRYLVGDVRARWEKGTLWDYRDQLRVPASTKACFALGSAALSAGGAMLIWGGLNVAPLSVVAATCIGGMAAPVAAGRWLHIALERRRHAADKAEVDQLRADRKAAFDRRILRLADKPGDLEMAHWLDCDRKAMIEEAMRHYKLEPHDVVAHAFIEAPATSYKRARVRGGPWRYSRYKLLVFLLTTDGVRQMSVDLDFENATFHNRGRINYRYDAVAAVHVTEADDGHRTFELTLVNGHPIKVEVTGPLPNEVEVGEDSRTVSQLTLDTAGLGNTLHVLEGIAAEGKEWINHERKREVDVLADLTKATHGLFFQEPDQGRDV